MNTIDDIYAPPKSDLDLEEKRIDLISDLKWKSTWWLLLLTIITAGIYLAHYIKRQNTVINSFSEPDEKIKNRYVTIFMFLSYLTVILILPSSYFEATDHYQFTQLFESIDNILNLIWTVYLLIWLFTARSRLHKILNIDKGDARWMNGFFTFILSVYYLNYKINRLSNG